MAVGVKPLTDATIDHPLPSTRGVVVIDSIQNKHSTCTYMMVLEGAAEPKLKVVSGSSSLDGRVL